MVEKTAVNTEQSTKSTYAVPVQTLAVFQADHFRVSNGVNLGDPIAHADEIELADIYTLASHAERLPLSLVSEDEHLTIADDSALGHAGADLHLDCVVTLMAASGETVEALVLVETDAQGMIEATYMLPFAPLEAEIDYAMITVDRDNARKRLAEVASVAFTRGTRITLANGMQVPIEELKVGDKVLTRDHGPKEIRWIGEQTVRATGAFAPIVIKQGALNNEHDLIVSPNHRIFIYQRRDAARAGRAEVLVKARLLVNGINVVQADGGFVDYFQLLFDSHEIIYAEGIAAESMFVDGQIKSSLPQDVQARLSQAPAFAEAPRAFELRDGMLEPTQAADLLRDASSR